MSKSEERILLNRREALLYSATAGLSAAFWKSALASDSIKTAAHQEPGNCSTPRSAVANTQYGKVRGYLDGGVLTFKGIPYGQDTSGANRWLPAKLGRTWTARGRRKPACQCTGRLPDVVPVGTGLAAGRLAGPDPPVPARGGP